MNTASATGTSSAMMRRPEVSRTALASFNTAPFRTRMIDFRKSYLQYILNRIDFGDQPPLAFGFTDGEARVTYDLTSKHTISLSDVEGASGVEGVHLFVLPYP